MKSNWGHNGKPTTFSTSVAVLALLFAASVIVGFAYQEYNSLLVLFAEPLTCLFAGTAFLVLAGFFYFVLHFVFTLFERRSLSSGSTKNNGDKNGSTGSGDSGSSGNSGNGNRYLRYLLYASIIFLLWLPSLIVFFPGNIAADGYWQIDFYYLGNITPYDIHPPFSTYLIGGLYFAGEALGDPFLAIALSCSVQTLLALSAYAAVCLYLENIGLKRKVVVAVAIFYGVVPLFSNIGFTIFKDSYYLSFFILFQIALIRAYQYYHAGTETAENTETAGTRVGDSIFADVLARCGVYVRRHTSYASCQKLIPVLLLGLVLCLFRKEAGFIVIASVSIMGVFFVRKFWLQFLTTLLALAAGIIVLGQLGLTSNSYDEQGISLEMASIPLQQTARYLRDAPTDVSDEELDIINQVFIYDADTPIADKYDPELSDNVKGFNIRIPFKTIQQYASVYLAMGLRHPEIYLDAFLNQTYGYYSPLFDSTTYYAVQSNGDGAGDYRLAPHRLMNDEVRENFLTSYLNAWRQLPLRLLWTGGLYAWIIAFLIVYLLRQRRFNALAVFAPVLLVFVFCILSPVNGNLRYLMPLITCAPLLVAFVLKPAQGMNIERH